MRLLHHLLLISIYLLNISQAEYVLTVIPDKVEIGITEDVLIECVFRGSLTTTDLRSISRLRILKQEISGNYEIVAEVRESENNAHNVGLGASANVSGHVDDVLSSKLSIYWDVATYDILGNYRCDIIGFKANLDVLVEKTPVFVLRETSVTIHDILDLTIKQKVDIQNKIMAQKGYCDRLVAAVETSIKTKMADIENIQHNSSEAFQNALLTQISRLAANVILLKDTGVFRYWPEGPYALIMPDSGCPESVGAMWKTGYRRFHTESTDRNYDAVSVSSHLQTPTMERVDVDNFMYQHFCVSKTRSPGPEWPRGTYCINRANNACPSGFSSGFVRWQDEVTNSKATFSGELPDGTFTANSTIIYYCCRTDGSPDNPIYLPKSRSFYLYRYNGTCQEVVGMRASPGDMTFDTDNSQGDGYENQYHPDGSINNVHIELCYYSEQ